jgi:hypothetical protein
MTDGTRSRPWFDFDEISREGLPRLLAFLG